MLGVFDTDKRPAGGFGGQAGAAGAHEGVEDDTGGPDDGYYLFHYLHGFAGLVKAAAFVYCATGHAWQATYAAVGVFHRAFAAPQNKLCSLAEPSFIGAGIFLIPDVSPAP